MTAEDREEVIAEIVRRLLRDVKEMRANKDMHFAESLQYAAVSYVAAALLKP